MRKNLFILLTVAASAAIIGGTVASAQSTDIVFLDDFPDDDADASTAADAGNAGDAATVPDAGASEVAADAGPDASTSGIKIEGISEELPEPQTKPKLENPRDKLAETVIEHVKSCIARHASDTRDIDVGFLYLVRKDRPSATLTSVNNDDGIHLPQLYVDIIRAVGETRPIDVQAQRRIFIECIEVVPLPVRPLVSERLSFRIDRTATSLVARDVAWKGL